ncbi:uncharacterized protein PGTG_04636 [Puccinia graminis f. sp. tritici CRL 75-36-700-3]|uniref:Uncharacterized protein n=1 Tax=Puccinia graminis f. sp. tritici (strain CRL 75-36-700-3 / race SCCL) TaxID=418459 RepID=E3K3M8_PUCGT|nr:uncharacterized protein PGTG_04636 [Puccinia graminis f. sp. tritici CRL 75-36-700-3]EFP78680.1 hypothetical protein PGTG_04636 [Puccinia graminis f. sp. tritici CRL 75-36-700-3]
MDQVKKTAANNTPQLTFDIQIASYGSSGSGQWDICKKEISTHLVTKMDEMRKAQGYSSMILDVHFESYDLVNEGAKAHEPDVNQLSSLNPHTNLDFSSFPDPNDHSPTQAVFSWPPISSSHQAIIKTSQNAQHNNFRRFKSEVHQYLQLEAQRTQQHKSHVEEIDSTFHHLNQHSSAKFLSNYKLKESANELWVGSRNSNHLLESSCQIMEAFHDSLLQQTIAINLEYKLKRQLFPTLPDSSPQKSQSSFISVREAKKEYDPERAKRI